MKFNVWFVLILVWALFSLMIYANKHGKVIPFKFNFFSGLITTGVSLTITTLAIITGF